MAHCCFFCLYLLIPVLRDFRTCLAPLFHHNNRGIADLSVGLIAHLRCSGIHDLLEELPRAMGDAGGFGEERLDGPAGFDSFRR